MSDTITVHIAESEQHVPTVRFVRWEQSGWVAGSLCGLLVAPVDVSLMCLRVLGWLVRRSASSPTLDGSEPLTHEPPKSSVRRQLTLVGAHTASRFSLFGHPRAPRMLIRGALALTGAVALLMTFRLAVCGGEQILV